MKISDILKELETITPQTESQKKALEEIKKYFQKPQRLWDEKELKVSDLLEELTRNPEIHDKPVMIFEDDGMGYGATNGPCITAYYDESQEEFRLWL